MQARITEAADGSARHPLLQLIGPVELLGARGTPPSRAARQCLEYCAWLLEHPGADGPVHGHRAAGGRGHAPVQHEPAPHLAGQRRGRGALPARRLQRPDQARPGGQLRLAPAAASSSGDGVDRAPSSVLELGLRLVRGRSARRRGTRAVALGRGAADRHRVLRPRHRRRARPSGRRRARPRPRPVGRGPGAASRRPETSCCSPPASGPSTSRATSPRPNASACTSRSRPVGSASTSRRRPSTSSRR